jgi:hypothetical protein
LSETEIGVWRGRGGSRGVEESMAMVGGKGAVEKGEFGWGFGKAWKGRGECGERGREREGR